MRLEIYLSDKIISPFKENEETTYQLGWQGTTEELKIRSAEDDKILEAVFFKFKSDSPKNYPKDLRAFSVGDVICIEDQAYKCSAEGWQKLDEFRFKTSSSFNQAIT